LHAFAPQPETTQQAQAAGPGSSSASRAGRRPALDPIIHLQHTAGNHAVERLLREAQTSSGRPPALRNPDPVQAATSAPPQISRKAAGASLVLQRKCACGAGALGPTGECEECRSGERSLLQAKLRISEPGDAFEQEADRMAEQVTTSTARVSIDHAPPRVQRVATASNGPTSAAPPSVSRALADPGRPLEPGLRWRMEDRFGQDFSRVRVHTGAAAAQSARDVDAHGYTVGKDIVFGAGRFAPETVEGRRLIAHELTHVLQQSAGEAHAGASIQRSPDKPVPKTKPRDEPRKKPKQVAYQISFDQSLSREEFIDLAEMTIYGRRTPGQWEGVPEHVDAADSPVTVRVPARTVESEVRKAIDELRPDIREFLMKQRPARDYASLDSLRRAGQLLELSGITEDELLLMDYRRGQSLQQGRKIDPVEWAQQLLLERQAVTEKAISNRASLVDAIRILEYLSPHDRESLKAVREGMFDFHTVDDILRLSDNLHGMYNIPRADTLVQQFEFELRSITQAFLAQANVALIRIEKTYLADKNVSAEKEALRATVEKIRPAVRQRDEAAREEARQSRLSVLRLSPLTEVFGERDPELDRARKTLEEADERLKKRSKEAGLEVAGWEKFDLDAIRGTDVNVTRNHLRYFVDSTRATLIKAEEKTRDINNLYKADRMIAFTKAAIGIKDGSPMDDIIAARARQATSDGGFWSTVWDVVTIALMFVPGNIGVALRVGAGLISAAEAMDQFSEGSLMHEAGLKSEAPSSLGVVLAVGGTLVDAGQLAKGVSKVGEEAGLAARFGSEASSAESTVVREGKSAIQAGEHVAEREAGRGLSQAEKEIAAEARPISQDVADRMTKTTYRGGGHDFRVLNNGRVVRCSPICGDADELLIEAYEDVFRANPHLHADLERLTELIRTDPDAAAKLAADLEERCARLSGSAFETGPARAVEVAEDVGGRLQPPRGSAREQAQADRAVEGRAARPRTPDDEFAEFEKWLREEAGASGPLTSDKLMQLYRHGSRATVAKYLRRHLMKQAAKEDVLELGEFTMKIKPGVPLEKQVDAFVKHLEGAHSMPQSFGNKLPKEYKYDPDDALVILTDKPTHTAMDQPWKDAFNDIRKSGNKEATAQKVFDAVADGIRRTPGMTESEKAARIARLHDEMFVELGLVPGQPYDVPRILTWPEILGFITKRK
jgi:hypothetical protein